MIAFDVQYDDTKLTAQVAGVCFNSHTDSSSVFELVVRQTNIAPYESGFFYKRELPCLLELYKQIPEQYKDILIVDSYVDLDEFGIHPGMGRYLYNATNKPVIGVAKTAFKGSAAVPVLHGASKSPLYVTSAGIDLNQAATMVAEMHGPYRIPTLLKRVDQLARMPSIGELKI